MYRSVLEVKTQYIFIHRIGVIIAKLFKTHTALAVTVKYIDGIFIIFPAAFQQLQIFLRFRLKYKDAKNRKKIITRIKTLANNILRCSLIRFLRIAARYLCRLIICI